MLHYEGHNVWDELKLHTQDIDIDICYCMHGRPKRAPQ
jgi:hypothetical protein